MKDELQDLIDLLHERKCSCVLRNGEIYTFERRGVEDLYALLREQPGLLLGADVADKVVGKGAAALMVLGRVRRVYADVLSEPGLRTVVSSGNLSVLRTVGFRYTESCGKRLVPGGNALPR